MEYSGLVLLTSIVTRKSAQVCCDPKSGSFGLVARQNRKMIDACTCGSLLAYPLRPPFDVINRSGGGRHVTGWCVYREWVNQDHIHPANPDQACLPALLCYNPWVANGA